MSEAAASPHVHARRRVLAALFAAAAALNLALLALYYFPSPKRLVGDESYYVALATAIASGQPAQHDPLWPPLYGEFVGLVFSIFGSRILVVQLIQMLLWAATGYAFFRIVERLYPSPGVATTALALYLFSPELIAFTHYLWPETIHLFLMMTGLWLVIRHAGSYPAILAGGILFGLACLTKSLLLPVLFVIALFVFLVPTGGRTARDRALRAALLVAAAVLTLLSASLASRGGGERYTPTGSSVFNIWVGLNDTDRVDYRHRMAGSEHIEFVRSGPDHAARNAVYIAKIQEKLGQDGIAATVIGQLSRQYFRLFDHDSFFTTQLMGGPRQAYAFDAPALARLLRVCAALLYGFVLIAGAAGIPFLRARPTGWSSFLLLFIAYNLAVFLFLHVVTRYRLQFLPMWIFFAAVSIDAGVRRWKGSGPAAAAGFAFTPARARLGLALGVVALVLAFRSLLPGS